MAVMPPGSATDEALVEAARSGDEGAFDALVRRYQEKVYGLALRLSGNPSDAEEILQEAFLKAYQHLAEFRGDAKFSTWLFRIATNAALMLRRARRHRATESLEDYLPRFREDGRLARFDLVYGRAGRVDQIIERGELARQIKEAVERLPDDYRVVVELRDLEELSTEETAEILGVSPEIVSTRLHRARLMLRGYLGHLAGGEE
jgi:RNA polymerase sigma-70 factor, ECF subfamily